MLVWKSRRVVDRLLVVVVVEVEVGGVDGVCARCRMPGAVVLVMIIKSPFSTYLVRVQPLGTGHWAPVSGSCSCSLALALALGLKPGTWHLAPSTWHPIQTRGGKKRGVGSCSRGQAVRTTFTCH